MFTSWVVWVTIDLYHPKQINELFKSIGFAEVKTVKTVEVKNV
ncbi:hypothetical protein VMC02_211 [Klebsiella phage ValerieMcCarty02]|nr:hypothetical protein VMC02_211 [Klebsiella phage ValerieMcCarty02]